VDFKNGGGVLGSQDLRLADFETRVRPVPSQSPSTCPSVSVKSSVRQFLGYERLGHRELLEGLNEATLKSFGNKDFK